MRQNLDAHRDLKVGEVIVERTELCDGEYAVWGVTKDLEGDVREVSATCESSQDATAALEHRAWSLVFSESRHAIDERTTLLQLVDITLKALRAGEAGQGNRIQTVNMYERHRCFIAGDRDYPAIGKLTLRECSTRAIHAWLSNVAEILPTSARHLRVLLLHAFDIAMRQEVGDWKNNPARTAKLPVPKIDDPVALTADEFQELLKRAQAWEIRGKRTDMVGILCCLMATGIRPGELPALLWDEVHLESTPATLIVSGCVVRQDGVLVRQPEPKTAAGYRQIVIPDWFAQMLRERRAKRSSDCPYVFPSNAGTLLCMHNIGTRFREVRGEEFSHVMLKSFRSTVATRIAEIRGAEEAARHLGHTSPSITGRHYIKRPKETGNHNDILAQFTPASLLNPPRMESSEEAA